jgi:hypothetical protein
MQIPERAQKDFLSDVFGVLAMSEHANAQAEYGNLKPFHKGLQRDFASAQTTANQIDLIVCHGRFLLSRCLYRTKAV